MSSRIEKIKRIRKLSKQGYDFDQIKSKLEISKRLLQTYFRDIKLIEYFKPYNKKLFELLGKTFDWDV